MPARITSREKRGVSRSRARIRVIVVAVGEVSAVIEKQPKSALAELLAISFQIIAAKLIDHDHHNQFGMCVVSGRERAWGET